MNVRRLALLAIIVISGILTLTPPSHGVFEIVSAQSLTPPAIQRPRVMQQAWQIVPAAMAATLTNYFTGPSYVCHLSFSSGGSGGNITVQDGNGVKFMDTEPIPANTTWIIVNANGDDGCRFFPGGLYMSGATSVNVEVSGKW